MFQFHTGSIKRRLRAFHVSRFTCFNSILVRLKVPIDVVGGLTFERFNSILVRLKVGGYFSTPFQITFQFHTGSIKSVFHAGIADFEDGFNSILVRLKVSKKRVRGGIFKRFNSILVRLKGDAAVDSFVELNCSFNSILVRLKGVY